MKDIEILNKLEDLRKRRGWSRYQLAKYSGVTGSTLSNSITRGTVPTIPILKSYLDALDITLSQFFEIEGKDKMSLEPEEVELVKNYRSLDKEIKKDVLDLARTLKRYHKL